MRLGLLLVFAAIPFLEIALLIKVGQAVGFWTTLMLVVLSATVGTYVIYVQGLQVLGRAAEAMSRGKPPVAAVINGLFILLAGLLLIIPGFLTDALGLALLVPSLRHRFAVWCLRLFLKSAEMRGFVFGTASSTNSGSGPGGYRERREHNHSTQAPKPPPGDGPIIEGEFERLDERTVDKGRGDPGRGNDDIRSNRR